MNQDEAWKAHVEEYDRDRFDSTSRHRRHCFDAGWDAALADTLGLLERLVLQSGCAARRNLSRSGNKWVEVRPEGMGALCKGLSYRRCDYTGIRPCSRDETRALLAGEEKKEKECESPKE